MTWGVPGHKLTVVVHKPPHCVDRVPPPPPPHTHMRQITDVQSGGRVHARGLVQASPPHALCGRPPGHRGQVRKGRLRRASGPANDCCAPVPRGRGGSAEEVSPRPQAMTLHTPGGGSRWQRVAVGVCDTVTVSSPIAGAAAPRDSDSGVVPV